MDLKPVTRRASLALALGAFSAGASLPAAARAPVFRDHYAQNGSVKIHYVSAGPSNRPLVVMIHGYPDFWYSWRTLMDELDTDYRVVAMDLRGYNLSDKPEGVEAYRHEHLIRDVEAVIKAEGRKSAIIVGHDWGGSIAWRTAIDRPDLVDRLVVLATPHPTNMAIELKTNPVQQRNSQYARNFQQPGSEARMTAESLANRIRDPADKAKYVEAFRRSNFTSMMNYYRANYNPNIGDAVVVPDNPMIKAPILAISGERDAALGPGGHNNTFLRSEKDVTVLWLPGVGHWIEDEAGPIANRTIHDWLNARPVAAAEQMPPAAEPVRR